MRVTARLCAVVLLVALTWVGGGAGAAQRPRVTVTAPVSVLLGKPATVTVSVRKGVAGQRAVLQRRASGRWVKVAAKPLPRKGAVKRVRFTVRPKARTSYRVRLLAKRPARAAVSRTVTIAVTKPAPQPQLLLASSPQQGQSGDDRVRDVAMSANGRYVVYTATVGAVFVDEDDGISQVYRKDLVTGTTVLVSASKYGVPGNANSSQPAISADGRFVAYGSDAGNLLIEPADNGVRDIFVWDADTKVVTLVTADVNGTPDNGGSGDPSISADGRHVAFYSVASDLVAGDTNLTSDVFVRDLDTATTKRISVLDDGNQASGHASNPRISADGDHVAYVTSTPVSPADTDTLPDVYLWDRSTGTSSYVSHDASGSSPSSVEYLPPDLSADGRYVVFTSGDPLAGGPIKLDHVFRWDRTTDSVILVDHTSAGAVPSGNGRSGRISADGSTIALTTGSDDLVGGPQQGVVVWHAGRFTTIPKTNPNASYSAGLSADGRYVALFNEGKLLGPETLRSNVYRWGPIA